MSYCDNITDLIDTVFKFNEDDVIPDTGEPYIKDLGNGLWEINTGNYILMCGDQFKNEFIKKLNELCINVPNVIPQK